MTVLLQWDEFAVLCVFCLNLVLSPSNTYCLCRNLAGRDNVCSNYILEDFKKASLYFFDLLLLTVYAIKIYSQVLMCNPELV